MNEQELLQTYTRLRSMIKNVITLKDDIKDVTKLYYYLYNINLPKTLTDKIEVKMLFNYIRLLHSFITFKYIKLLSKKVVDKIDYEAIDNFCNTVLQKEVNIMTDDNTIITKYVEKSISSILDKYLLKSKDNRLNYIYKILDVYNQTHLYHWHISDIQNTYLEYFLDEVNNLV